MPRQGLWSMISTRTAKEKIALAVAKVAFAAAGVLVEKVLDALHQMAEQGTTTVEAKSGYGLTVDSEIRSLEAEFQRAKHAHALRARVRRVVRHEASLR